MGGNPEGIAGVVSEANDIVDNDDISGDNLYTGDLTLLSPVYKQLTMMSILLDPCL